MPPTAKLGYVSTKDQRYYLKHRNKLLEKMNSYVQCECGQWTTKSNIYNHLKSKRHFELIKDNTKFHYCNDCKSYVNK
jgi:hypothetical protein